MAGGDRIRTFAVRVVQLAGLALLVALGLGAVMGADSSPAQVSAYPTPTPSPSTSPTASPTTTASPTSTATRTPGPYTTVVPTPAGPALKLKLKARKGQKLRKAVRRGLRVRASCNRACAASIRAFKSRKRVGSGSKPLRGRSGTVKVKFKRKARKRLLRKRKVTLQLLGQARDARGRRSAVATARVRLKR
jgi:hypothetical protein